MKNIGLFEYDMHLRGSYPILCGVDEAGRGPLAGPVCCAAVILKKEYYSPALNDSKKMSEKNRELVFQEIIDTAIAYSIRFVFPDVIDQVNILKATMLCMKDTITTLNVVPNLVLIDGNSIPDIHGIEIQPVIKGDSLSASISAASVLAKVTRDRYMLDLHEKYPMYQFDKHKGYPTKLHYEMIEKYGVQEFHRKSFLKKRGIT